MFILNLVSLIVLTVGVIVGTALGGPDSYVRFGPGTPDFPLLVLSLNIDTWGKWVGLVIVLVLLALADVVISQTAMMDIYNNIYNSAQKEVTDFASPAALQWYAQLMYGMNAIRYILSVKISITQIDLALITTAASQLMTIKTIREKILTKFYGDHHDGVALEHGADDDSSEYKNPAHGPTTTRVGYRRYTHAY